MAFAEDKAIKLLHQIYNIDQLLFGEDLIKELVKILAVTLEVKYVMIGHAVEPEREKIKSDVLWANGEFANSVVYDLKGTPCVNVICGTRVLCLATQVAASYPEDQMLKDMSVDSYIGAPFLQSDGGLLGLLVVMDDKPVDNKELYSAIVEFFAARIGTEYRRSALESTLRSNNENLERIIQERTSELKTAFENLKRTQRKLVSQEKLATIGRITVGIAHELKNPLNVIINSAEIIKDSLHEGLDKELIEKTSDMIYNHGNRANNIIMDMLKQARQDTEGSTESVDIANMVHMSLDMCIRSIADTDFKGRLQISETIPRAMSTLLIDPASIERAFINIFDNALYALKKKFQLQEPFIPTLNVEIIATEDVFTIRIKDNGIGIPEKLQRKVFDEFYTTKPAGEGTGLGLSIAKQTFERNGGDIRLTSKEGEGTEILIHLPHLESTVETDIESPPEPEVRP
ncbi:MAG: GAF domain-containing sensor histidine kinase [Bdellovibrio sp.]|nr:GAF domain-containing sensor histidine kinase [Bdellovibrio sp.]